MKWNTKKKGTWHRYFAFTPKLVVEYNTVGGNTYAWLCWIERKLTQQEGKILKEYRLLA